MYDNMNSFIKNDLQKRLYKFAVDNDFSGDISIYMKDSELIHSVYGYRDKANRIENNTSTLFGIASGTKLFTALGIFKLIETGKIKLSTTVSDLFDEELSFIDPDATIEQLLCHTSGIFDYYDEELITDFDNYKVSIPWAELETPSDYLPLFKGESPKFPAGTKSAYSNGGYIFLGILIEKLTGRKYMDFISEQILQPGGMKRSGFFAFNSLPENTANGYIETVEEVKTNIYQLPIRGGSDGGMYTSSRDLNNFWNTLFNLRIINQSSINEICRKRSRLWDSIDYGLGIYIPEKTDYQAYFITGSDAGVGFSSRFIPELRLNINVLSNHTDGNVKVMKFILGQIGALK